MIIGFALACFVLAALCGTYRLLVGPGLADRVLALDVILVSLMGAIAVNAARTGTSTDLVLLAVIAIIGFTATVAASRFLEHESELALTPPDAGEGEGDR